MTVKTENTRSNTGLAVGLAVVLTLFRLWTGWLWTQQQGWKFPWVGSGGFGCDAYRFQPPAGQELHGLCNWMKKEVDYPTIGLFGDFVKNIVIPNFDLFAWLTVGTETFITYSLLFGFLTRLGGLVGTIWGLNLLIGLSGIPGESVFAFLPYVLPPLVFAIIGARHQFGVDALLANRYERWTASGNPAAKLLKWASGAKPGSAGVI